MTLDHLSLLVVSTLAERRLLLCYVGTRGGDIMIVAPFVRVCCLRSGSL